MSSGRASLRPGGMPGRTALASATAITAAMLCMTASPAWAASCRTDTVSTQAVLAPGESAATRQTLAVPSEEITLVASEPSFSGDLGPYLQVRLLWCAGVGCTPQETLTPLGDVTFTAPSVTIEQVVSLTATAPTSAVSGIVRSRVNLTSDTCNRSVDAADSGGTADQSSAGGGLATTGANLTAVAWGSALLAAGAFLWMAGRSRRQAER
ncbi:MAG TPA: hypothetical protein PLQ63_12465 [Propionicimonas sp.]|nr:hypothetical protein [Propionicimonas sp.]